MSHHSDPLTNQFAPYFPQREGTISHLSNTPTLAVTQVPQPSESYQGNRSETDESAVMGVGFLLVFSVLYFIFRKKRSDQLVIESLRPSETKYHRSGSSIPCRHCQYFHPNLHLQCAVHPDMVLKRQATDCMDFRDRNGEEDAAA